MKKIFCLLLFLACCTLTRAQNNSGKYLSLLIKNDAGAILPDATVLLLNNDSVQVKSAVSDHSGKVLFTSLPNGLYRVRVSLVGHATLVGLVADLINNTGVSQNIDLLRLPTMLKDVTVTAKKVAFQFLPDKTVVNVEASITNAGATVMEVLEKSPGISIDRNGNISMKGRPAVMVMIDGKMTQLSGTDLQNLLSGMNASQVDVIELIDNPGAKYDAAGNAGIINIKTKKTKQVGFNGSASIAIGQGRLPKNNNSLIMNYRKGSLNYFLNYSSNLSKSLLDVYALRTYFKDDGSASLLLQQPAFNSTSNRTHNIKTGIDYFINKSTTVGLALTGTLMKRRTYATSTIEWMQPNRMVDSTISTIGIRSTKLQQGGVNLNGRHTISDKKEFSVDLDMIRYDIKNAQYFENQLLAPASIAEASSGDIPSRLTILSGKADYSHRDKNMLWESGLKTARVSTDNTANYYRFNGSNWDDDLGKSNHFIYTEYIHAAYSSVDIKSGKWHWQTGLRYENTSYKARQLGNAVIKDSSFNRNYSSLFPTAFLTYEIDSSNSLTVRTGRRIDRPSFNKLNPFVFILNKYTFQSGNPFFKPQYTWNFEISHLYKQVLSTGISYNYTKDYFSQIFLADTANGTITYTEGNVGKLKNFGVSMSLQLSPKKWWSFTAQAIYNHKMIEGVLWRPFKTSIHQATMNFNNQFKFNKGWGAELSGYYISRNQNDLQEALDPTGQLGVGVSKQLFKNKATLRFVFRDIFYTQDMEGLSHFENSDEYFRLQWDSRVATISFIYRFGKAMKQPKRTGGGAADEMNRVGTGN